MITQAAKDRFIAHSLQEQLAAHRAEIDAIKIDMQSLSLNMHNLAAFTRALDNDVIDLTKTVTIMGVDLEELHETR